MINMKKGMRRMKRKIINVKSKAGMELVQVVIYT